MMDTLGLINKWFMDNKLTINLDKSMFITFVNYANSLPENNHSLTISDYKLTRPLSRKYLGIYFDKHMHWDIHTQNLLKRIKYLLFIFYKLRHINKQILKIIYYSLFLGVISYAFSIWGCAYDNSLNFFAELSKRKY